LNDPFSIPLRDLSVSDDADDSWMEDMVESVDLSGSAENSWTEETVELASGARELLSRSDFQDYEQRVSQRGRNFTRDV
jgi:hypothetical protein